jgi:GWxTD domain-containing protein
MKLRRSSLSALLSAAVLAAPASAQGTTGDPFDVGLRIRDAGDWRQALEVWESAWDSLSFEGAYDPRIGIAYLETVTSNAHKPGYELGSEMYLWGLSTDELDRYAEALAEEVARIEPLLGDDDKGRLPVLLEDRNPLLSYELKRFWIELDPTPSTRYNERLIEHWERIAYARDRYTNGRYTVYDTDDRGEYYVRYGPPHKREAGTMGSRESELQFWIRDLDDRNQLRRYDKSPSYEVWVYEQINDDELVFLLFGQKDGSGRYQLLDGPADLIAPEAYSASTRRYTPGGIRAGFFLELFYYSEISSIGGPWGARFDELNRAWGWNQSEAMLRGGIGPDLSPPSESELEAFKYRWEQEDRYAKTWVPEIPTLSVHDFGTRFLNLRAWAFRTLSEENQPRVTVVALSAPRIDVERTQDLRRDLGVPEFTLGHTLIVRDERLEEVGRMPSVASSPRGDISLFPLRHVDRQMHFTVITDAHSESPSMTASERPPGRAYITTDEPLNPDPDRLELSDLVTGVPPWQAIDADILPFPIVPSARIWEEEGLRVYIEAYHLRPDPNGVHGLTADFVVRAVDEEGEPTDDPEPVTLSVDLEEASPTAGRSFDLDVRELPIGRYRLDVTITDRVSGDRKTRSADFEIVGR